MGRTTTYEGSKKTGFGTSEPVYDSKGNVVIDPRVKKALKEMQKLK